MSEEVKTARGLFVAAAITLFIATIAHLPYGFYTFLRLLVCGASIYAVYQANVIESLKVHKVPLIIVAILFNPLAPIHLSRSMWSPIDLGVGVYFLFLATSVKEKNAN